jgi:hypothetical protein
MPNKEIKPLRFNKIDKFAAKLENEIDIIGNAAVLAVKSFKTIFNVSHGKHNSSGQRCQK